MGLTFHFSQPLLGFGTVFVAHMTNADTLVTIKQQSGEIIYFQ